MAYTSSSLGVGCEGVKILENFLLEGSKFCLGGGAGVGGGSLGIWTENLTLRNSIIKSIFRITNLIYFRCIRNTH